jgi:heme/copper-type cytochrome/quinol oxidase subunit 2
MEYVLPVIGVLMAFIMIVFRENLGDALGETKWIHDHGGIYTWVVIAAVFIFLWSLASIFGLTHYLFDPFRSILPGKANYFL